MNKISLYVFRHGETDWNAERRFQGYSNIDLNNRGRDQAKALAQKMKALHVDIMLSSDLSRALETASIVNQETKVKLVVHHALRETFLGEPEGMLREDVIKKYGEESWQRWLSVDPADLDFAFPKGESKRDQLTRVRIYLEQFMNENHDMKNLAVSTHGGALRRLVHFCEKSPKSAIEIENCCVYHVTYDTGTHVWEYVGSL